MSRFYRLTLSCAVLGAVAMFAERPASLRAAETTSGSRARVRSVVNQQGSQVAQSRVIQTNATLRQVQAAHRCPYIVYWGHHGTFHLAGHTGTAFVHWHGHWKLINLRCIGPGANHWYYYTVENPDIRWAFSKHPYCGKYQIWVATKDMRYYPFDWADCYRPGPPFLHAEGS